MDEFIEKLGELLDKAEDDINEFEREFEALVKKYENERLVKELAAIFAHNYNCHKFGREAALITSIEQIKTGVKVA